MAFKHLAQAIFAGFGNLGNGFSGGGHCIIHTFSDFHLACSGFPFGDLQKMC
jgi:hypothetical protein